MPQFNVGDRVRCISAANNRHLHHGAVYTISNCNSTYAFLQEFGDTAFLISRFESCTPAPSPTHTVQREIRVGDRVRCIDHGDNVFITLGREYTVLGVDGNKLIITNDGGYRRHYFTRLFELVEDTTAHAVPEPVVRRKLVVPPRFIHAGVEVNNVFTINGVDDDEDTAIATADAQDKAQSRAIQTRYAACSPQEMNL